MNSDPLPISDRAFSFIRQFLATMLLHRQAYYFIRKYRPWDGLPQYGWVLKTMIVIGVIVGWQIFSGFYKTLSQVVTDPLSFGASVSAAFANFSFEKFNWMLDGGQKYLVLIVLEIITFHFIQRTLEIRMGRKPDHSFHAFVRAEKRMIAVSIVSWVMESILRLLVKIPIGILGFSWLGKPAELVIQFFFLGFAFIDNYHECFHLTVEESRKRTWRVAGVAVAAGLVAHVLMFVPIAGVVAATMLGAVTAGMAMERFAPLSEAEILAYEELRAVKKQKKA